jgi:hypothetical protein
MRIVRVLGWNFVIDYIANENSKVRYMIGDEDTRGFESNLS